MAPARPRRSAAGDARRRDPRRHGPDRDARHDSERHRRPARRQDRRGRRRRTPPIPPGAEIIDATGRFVSPGIIDAHSHIAADSINEGGTTVSSMTGIEDVLDPTDVNIYRDLAGGLTVANVLHGSANPIGGKNTVIKLRWGKTRAERAAVRGRDAGHQVRARREPEGHAARRRRPAAGAAPLPGHARRASSSSSATRSRAPRRIRGTGRTTSAAQGAPAKDVARRRAAICSSSRSSRSSKASASCTRTAIAPTRS